MEDGMHGKGYSLSDFRNHTKVSAMLKIRLMDLCTKQRFVLLVLKMSMIYAYKGQRKLGPRHATYEVSISAHTFDPDSITM